MRKIILLLTTILAITNFASGQSQTGRGTIKGKLIDDATQEAIPEANIRILNQKDSTYVTGKASEKNGTFSIPISNGNYIVQISYIGYSDLFKDVSLNNRNATANLGTLSLIEDGVLLSDALVTAKALEVVVRGDTVEYNADSYKVTESAVIEDLLKKMPGVEVDADGKITVNGQEIKKILVDGKEFFSDDPKVASKNLPAKMVDKLQVLERRTDMSLMTGFDDGDEEMVINLTVKPGMKEGVFGNAFAGYGSQDRYEANAMVNYMRDKDQLTFLGGLNNTNNAGFSDLASAMFGGSGGRGRGRWGGRSGITKSANAGLNFSKEFNEKLKLGGNVRYGDTDTDMSSSVYTQNLLSSENTFERENNVSNNYSQNINMDFRLEWEPDSMTKFIFRPNASFYNNNRSEVSDFSTVRAEGDTINHGDSQYLSEGTGKSIGGTLEASRKLGSTGRVLSFSVGGGIDDSENNAENLSNTFYSSRADDIIDQRIKNTNDGKNLRFYASYVEPLGKNNFLQLAYNYRYNRSESDRDTRTKDINTGEYTVLDTAYSKRLENDFHNQNVELNFRATRDKYNYMVGVSMQPSKSESKIYKGETLEESVSQNVINFAPMAQFNYMWSRQNNLRINYYGRTNQPSVSQLSSVKDISNPLSISYGNPDLKPAFDHRLRLRYRNFNPEKGSSYMFMSNAGFTVNDIVSWIKTNQETGRRESTYDNTNGNWNASARFMTNQPLRNIKFSVFSMSYASYNNSNGFTTIITDLDESSSIKEKNTSKRLNLGETLGVNYRSDQFDFSVRGTMSYNKVNNSLEGQQNQEYFNYGGNASTTIYLPFDLLIESDINYSTNSGYADGFDQDELLWNAALSKQLFKDKNGTIRFKIYDILKQKSDISRAVTANYIRDTTTNTLTSYFMFHFVYRFNIFKGGGTAPDASQGRGMGRGMGRGRPH